MIIFLKVQPVKILKKKLSGFSFPYFFTFVVLEKYRDEKRQIGKQG